MNIELLTLHQRVHFAGGIEPLTPSVQVLGLNTEIAAFGYTFDHTLIERLAMLTPAAFATIRNDLHRALAELSGARANHQVLFNGFPYETPDHLEYLVQRIIGYWETYLRDIETERDCTMLSCGHVIFKDRFDINDFGHCPICQFQVDELIGHETVKHPYERITPLKVLGYADGAFISTTANALLARNGSLSATERKFLEWARDEVILYVPEKVYRENIPYVYSIFGGPGGVKNHLTSVTDVLRIATYCSNPEADLSLAANTRFKLTTRQKKHMFEMLERFETERQTEDMLRHREQWLRLGEILQPAWPKNRAKWPKTAKAFDLLRNHEKSIETFYRTTEKYLRAGTINERLLSALRSRPGEFMRRIDWMLRENPSHRGLVLNALGDVLPKVDPKLIFAVQKAFEYRRMGRDFRFFSPKGETNKMKFVEDRRERLMDSVLDDIYVIFSTHLAERFASLPAMGRVYLDPDLSKIVLPFNQRGDSATTTPISKGSHYPIMGDVVRLFTHWTGHVDVDLSVAFYNGRWDNKGHVAFTNTRMTGCVHSGDVQNAPDGASEFIDMDLNALEKIGVRYAVPSVISYRGDGFNTFPCFAGMMERDKLKSGKRYEPQSVKWKFDLNTPNTMHTPFIFDLMTREVVYCDLASGGGRYRAVVRNGSGFAQQAQAVLDMAYAKPTVIDVLGPHVRARGELVGDPESADLTFMADTISLADIVATYVDQRITSHVGAT
jgi:hypothetical protein